MSQRIESLARAIAWRLWDHWPADRNLETLIWWLEERRWR